MSVKTRSQTRRTAGISSANTPKRSQAGGKRKINSPVVSSKSNKPSLATQSQTKYMDPIISYIQVVMNVIKVAWEGRHADTIGFVDSFVDKVRPRYPIFTTFVTVMILVIGLQWHDPALRVLIQTFPYDSYERTSDVKFIIDKFDLLRSKNPDKEVHVVISGGPGTGKSELARQFGHQIYNRDNRYDLFWRLFGVYFAFPPVDVVTLNAASVGELQDSLETVLGKCKGKSVSEIIHATEAREENVLTKFIQLKEALKKRSSRPVIIFDNVQKTTHEILYKKRDNGRFILHPGNDEYGEIRIVVTTQHRPSSKFPTVISYMNLFDGMPINESVNLLNVITKVHNDNKNARYLVKELGGLPLSLACAALYIQSANELHGNFSYYHYLKEFKLDLEKYRHNIETIWKHSKDEGLTYNMTIIATSIKTVNQLVKSSDHDLYKDLACFVGYCDSQTISAQLFWKYTRMNPALQDLTRFDVNTLVRKSSIYEHINSLILTHQVTREASRIVCNLRDANQSDPKQLDFYFVENSLARIVNVIATVLVAKPEASLNQITEYTKLNYKVVDVLMSLVSHSFKQNLDISKVITKEFCWTFLDSMAEAYLYWPNKHKSTVIMPDVTFLVKMTEESFSADKPELGVFLSILYLYNTGNQEPRDLEKVVEWVENFAKSSFENVDKTSIEKTALLLNMVGIVYRDVGQKMSKAQELHELALNISQAFGSSSEIAVSLHLLGIIHRYTKHLDIAKQYHEQAVELARKIYSDKNPRLGAFLLNMAVVYNRQGELNRAKVTYHEALNVTEEAYGARDQRVARVLNTLATNYYSLGQYTESVDVLLKANIIHEEIHGDFHPNVAETLYVLGFTYRAKGDLEKSLESLERSLKIRQQYYGSRHYHVAEVLHDLSNTQRELHRLEDALENAKGCLEIFQSSLGEKSSEVGVSLNGIGLIYVELGDIRMAQIKHEKALEIFEKLNEQGSQTGSISETLKHLGNVFQRLEKTTKAQEYFSRSLSMLQTIYESNHPRIQEINKLLKYLE